MVANIQRAHGSPRVASCRLVAMQLGAAQAAPSPPRLLSVARSPGSIPGIISGTGDTRLSAALLNHCLLVGRNFTN